MVGTVPTSPPPKAVFEEPDACREGQLAGPAASSHSRPGAVPQERLSADWFRLVAVVQVLPLSDPGLQHPTFVAINSACRLYR